MDYLYKISYENLKRAIRFLKFKKTFFQLMIDIQKRGITLEQLNEHLILRETEFKLKTLPIILADFPQPFLDLIPSILRFTNNINRNNEVITIDNTILLNNITTHTIQFYVNYTNTNINKIYILVDDQYLLSNYINIRNADIFFTEIKTLLGLDSISDVNLILDFLLILLTNTRNDEWFRELSIDKQSIWNYNFIDLHTHNYII